MACRYPSKAERSGLVPSTKMSKSGPDSLGTDRTHLICRLRHQVRFPPPNAASAVIRPLITRKNGFSDASRTRARKQSDGKARSATQRNAARTYSAAPSLTWLRNRSIEKTLGISILSCSTIALDILSTVSVSFLPTEQGVCD